MTIFDCGAIGKNSAFSSAYTGMRFAAVVGQYGYLKKIELVRKDGSTAASYQNSGQAEVAEIDGIFKARCSNTSGKDNALQCGYA